MEGRDQLPGPRVRLLARRSAAAPDKLAFSRAYASPMASCETSVRVTSTHATAEPYIEEARGENGLAEEDVHFWHRWDRHITLSMRAHAWLVSITWRKQKKALQLMRLRA